MQQALAHAASDPTAGIKLLEERDKAARAWGFELTPTEAEVLRAVPRDQLDRMITQLGDKPHLATPPQHTPRWEDPQSPWMSAPPTGHMADMPPPGPMPMPAPGPLPGPPPPPVPGPLPPPVPGPAIPLSPSPPPAPNLVVTGCMADLPPPKPVRPASPAPYPPPIVAPPLHPRSHWSDAGDPDTGDDG